MNNKMVQRVSYALGAFGHDTFYVTLSTYFMISWFLLQVKCLQEQIKPPLLG